MRQFLICLCAVYLVGSFQSVSTAAELEGLVVYFAFEAGAGKTVKDLSGNKQDGKLEGDTSWTDGKFGKAVDFGGKDGIVRVEHSELRNHQLLIATITVSLMISHSLTADFHKMRLKKFRAVSKRFWQLNRTQNCRRHGDRSNRDMKGAVSQIDL